MAAIPQMRPARRKNCGKIVKIDEDSDIRALCPPDGAIALEGLAFVF